MIENKGAGLKFITATVACVTLIPLFVGFTDTSYRFGRESKRNDDSGTFAPLLGADQNKKCFTSTGINGSKLKGRRFDNS